MVESSLRYEYKPGMTEDELLANFAMYGEDPIIVPTHPDRKEWFSARDYAHKIAGKICTESVAKMT